MIIWLSAHKPIEIAEETERIKQFTFISSIQNFLAPGQRSLCYFQGGRSNWPLQSINFLALMSRTNIETKAALQGTILTVAIIIHCRAVLKQSTRKFTITRNARESWRACTGHSRILHREKQPPTREYNPGLLWHPKKPCVHWWVCLDSVVCHRFRPPANWRQLDSGIGRDNTEFYTAPF